MSEFLRLNFRVKVEKLARSPVSLHLVAVVAEVPVSGQVDAVPHAAQVRRAHLCRSENATLNGTELDERAALGCVNYPTPHLAARASQEDVFTQPQAHSLTQLCTKLPKFGVDVGCIPS